MTIYKATKKIYHYWLDAYKSGYVEVEKYFMSAEKAEAWMHADLNKWYDMNNELVVTDNELRMGKAGKVEAIEVEE